MKRYVKVISAIFVIFTLFVFLGFQQSKTKIVALASTPIGFQIFKPDSYTIKTVQNPIGNVESAKAMHANMPTPNISNMPNFLPPLSLPALPTFPPLPSGNTDNTVMKIVGITYSSNNQKAMLKLGEDYITVTPGYLGKGFSVVSIEKDSVYLQVGDDVQQLKYIVE